MNRIKSRRTLFLAPLAALALLAVLVIPNLAAAESPAMTGEEGVATIEIKIEGKKMGFFGPKTVHEGEVLRVVNMTSPGQVGPHTFSLVTKGSLPKTAKLRKECFTPGKICMGIAHWYGLKGEEIPKKPLVEAGQEGWDTMGTVSKKGDSYFFAKKGEAVEQVVTPGHDGIMGTPDDQVVLLNGFTREIEIRDVEPALRQIKVTIKEKAPYHSMYFSKPS